MIKKESRNSLRKQRHLRTKNKIFGTKECPRLNIFKSNTNIYAQIIDDTTFSTLVSASSLELKLNKVNIETSKKVGEELAKKAKAAKISKVVFDKGGYKYHGCVKALADAAREKGLEF